MCSPILVSKKRGRGLGTFGSFEIKNHLPHSQGVTQPDVLTARRQPEIPNAIQPGDRVVCLADEPTLAGKTRAVSGISDGGKTIWVYDPDGKTGAEQPLPAFLICPVAQFRAKFSCGFQDLLKRSLIATQTSTATDFQLQRHEQPQLNNSLNVLKVIRQSMITVEGMFNQQEFINEVVFTSPEPPDWSLARANMRLDFDTRQIKAQLTDLMSCPRHFAAQAIQARIFWQLLRRKQRLIIFHRRLSPVAGTLFKLGQRGRLNLLPQIIGGYMPESDIPQIMSSGGRLVAARHFVSLCDAHEPNTFLSRLRQDYRQVDYALCDWNLTAQEKAGACRITRHSHIKILCPDY